MIYKCPLCGSFTHGARDKCQQCEINELKAENAKFLGWWNDEKERTANLMAENAALLRVVEAARREIMEYHDSAICGKSCDLCNSFAALDAGKEDV
jgi:hypothetical protein